ncbi:SurA N-terminal domain-containing protein [Pseudomonas oryzihabitans]|uniref:SurA N-terminal domain-containing protein n=1 Tax=Pseudomonas oryzihabitans TaxID=47885 RepID=UPI0028635FAB|nr:SurA N-terminal domain-containing protein [Pseudomonas psychrotolerans]MDR6679843.1 peptidyl-prolyl cis-trans isomerase D [Pseudomonas psychrotolerans]
MLQNIRDRSQGWIAKVIIGFIILLMALTGFEAIIRATGHQGAVALVNGDEIKQTDLNQAMEMQRRQLQQQLGQSFDPSTLDDRLLRESALKALIDKQLLLQAAKADHFAFSDQALDQLILNTPEFQTEGRFDPQRFDQAVRQMNYTRLQFRDLLRDEMLIGQLRAGIVGSNFVTDADIEAFANLERQTRDFSMRTVKASTAGIAPTQAEIQAYYDSHKNEFMTPEQVVIEYVELKKSAFLAKAKVDESRLQAAYKSEIANLSEQRDAAHILIEVNDKQTDEQAKAKIQQIQERLNKGEDFAKLAKEFSQDPGSAANGGDLGYAGRGVYDPAFEEALYALKPNQVSAPVRTSFGWHLIKLKGIQAPEIPTLASVRPRLEQQLKAEDANRLFIEAGRKLESDAYEASDLSQPAQDMGLQVQTSKPFGREGGEGITANRQVIEAAFSEDVMQNGANSAALQLDPDTIVVLRDKEHRAPQLQSLDQVKAEIVTRLTQDKAAALAKSTGEEQLKALRDGGKVAAGDWRTVEAATRNQEGIDPQVLQAVFRMAKPESDKQPSYAGVSLQNGDFVLLRLQGVGVPKEALSAEDKALYRRYLASRAGQVDFAAYRRALEAKAEIKNL